MPPSHVSYHTPPLTTRCIVPLMMNGCAAPSQNELLLRPHERHHFTGSPARFITVIKVPFSDILLRNSLLAILPDTFGRLREWVAFLFLSRWTSPAWIINSNRLRTEKQIASFKHENDWAKGWQTQQSAFIKAVYMRPESQLLGPLEKWPCCAYNSSLTCCIYWKTNLSHGRPDWFSAPVISSGPNYRLISCRLDLADWWKSRRVIESDLKQQNRHRGWEGGLRTNRHLKCCGWQVMDVDLDTEGCCWRSLNNLACMKSCKSSVRASGDVISASGSAFCPHMDASGATTAAPTWARCNLGAGQL